MSDGGLPGSGRSMTSASLPSCLRDCRRGWPLAGKPLSLEASDGGPDTSDPREFGRAVARDLFYESISESAEADPV